MSEEFRGVREGLARAIRRLSALEYVILLAIVVLAMLGGAVLAFLLQAAVDAPFRMTWVVGSILLLVLPGALVLGRDSIRDRASANRERESMRDEDDG